jgi:hypothetical protein
MRLSRKGAVNRYLGLPFWGAMLFTAIAAGGVMWVRVPEKTEETTSMYNSRIVEDRVQAELLI